MCVALICAVHLHINCYMCREALKRILKVLGTLPKKLTASLYNYNTIAICHPVLIHDVQTVWEQLFGNVDAMLVLI